MNVITIVLPDKTKTYPALGDASVLTEDCLSSCQCPAGWANIIRYGGVIDMKTQDHWVRRNLQAAIKANSEAPLLWESM